MSLITCPECGKEISDKAAACPNCGCPNTKAIHKPEGTSKQKSREKLRMIIGMVSIAIGLLFIFMVISSELEQE